MPPKPPDILRKSHRHTERKQRAESKARLREQLLDAAPDDAAVLRYTGACSCGSIRYVFATRVPPADWAVRRCACALCASHDALYTADPDGAIAISAERRGNVERHRLGAQQTELLICRRCGDLVAALTPQRNARFAAANLRLLDEPPVLPRAARETREHRSPVHARSATPLSASSTV